MIATTIEQSERLLACGIKAETADMCRMGWELTAHPYSGLLAQWIGDAKMKGYDRTAEDFDLTPAWSLSALLTEVLPNTMDKQIESELELGIFEDTWYCKYCYSATEVWANNPIEACVRMVELLHEKKLL